MSVAFSPDGKSLAVGYGAYSGDQVGRVKVWDVASGTEIKAFTGPRGGVNKVAFHPDGRRLAVAGSEVVEVWDLETARKLHDLKGHKKWVYCLAYSPDGKWLATGGWDRTVKLRDAATGVEALTIFAHEGFVLSLAFSPDSRNLVTTSEDRSVRLWEVPSGRRLAAFHGHTDFVRAVAFRPDGREVVTGERGWVDPVLGSQNEPSRRGRTRRLGDSTRLPARRTSGPLGAGWIGRDATKGWNPFTGELDTVAGRDQIREATRRSSCPGSGLQTNASQRAPMASWSCGKADSACDGWGRRFAEQGILAQRESSSAKRRAAEIVHTLTGHSADVISVAFSPDSRRLATASYDRTMKLWDMQTGQDVFTLLGHTAGVVCLAFSPDGNQIVSEVVDATARVWNATPLASNVIAEHDARYRKEDRDATHQA